MRICPFRRMQLFFARIILLQSHENIDSTYRPHGEWVKTELSLRLAEHFGTCIVSADSRQLYADLKIGTAAPTPEQQQRYGITL